MHDVIPDAAPRLVAAGRASPAPLFQEEWWLDAASAGAWDRAEVIRDGLVVASLPFTTRRRAGLRFIELPRYTHTVAPHVRATTGKPVTQLGDQVATLCELLARLPPHDRLELTLDPVSTLAFPFVALGYLVSHKYTFVAPSDCSADELWSGMDQKTRNAVVAAAKRFDVGSHTDLDRFIRVSHAEHGSGRRNVHDFRIMSRIFDECAARGQGVVLSASDDHGDVAASVLVWGGGKLYHWQSARDPKRAGGGAGSLVLWEGLRFACARGLTFDADGFRTRGAALFLSRFGLRPVARPVVNRGSFAWRFALLVKTAFQPDYPDLFYRG